MEGVVKKKAVDLCKCGHVLDKHEICDCPHCQSGVHGCFANASCECQEYEEKSVTNHQ